MSQEKYEYGKTYQLSPSCKVIRAENPSPMTGLGTNTYFLATGSGFIVVDPGPADSQHLENILKVGKVEGILLSHEHIDHAEGTPALVDATGVDVVSPDLDQTWKRSFQVDSVLVMGNLEVVPISTPGHTPQSTSFYLPEEHAILTGDALLESNSVALARVPGSMRSYFASLDIFESMPGVRGFPGHGPVIPDVAETAARWRQHRMNRLDEVQTTVANTGLDSAEIPLHIVELMPLLYPPLEGILWRAAERTLYSQLEYLFPESFVEQD